MFKDKNTKRTRKRGNTMRNVIKNAQEGKKIVRKRPGLDLSTGELKQLYEIFDGQDEIYNGLWDAITCAYDMGLAVGMRNAKR